jgi:hypothetical protein
VPNRGKSCGRRRYKFTAIRAIQCITDVRYCLEALRLIRNFRNTEQCPESVRFDNSGALTKFLRGCVGEKLTGAALKSGSEQTKLLGTCAQISDGRVHVVVDR